MHIKILTISCAIALSACSPSTHENSQSESQTAVSAQQIQSESQRLNEWFEIKYEEQLLNSPIQLTMLGRDERQGELDEFTEQAVQEKLARVIANLEELTSKFDYDKLNDDAKMSYDLWVYEANSAIAANKFTGNAYIFEQMNAVHTFLPQLLISFQKVEDHEGINNYLSRIKAGARALNQLIDKSKALAENNVRPPYFAFDETIKSAQSIITGAPFTEGDDSAIWADAKAKVDSLLAAKKIKQSDADTLIADIKSALLNDFQKAYQNLIAWQQVDKVNATKNAHGISELPNGKAYYEERLANQTTTKLTADEIHNIGLSEVTRLRKEMENIKEEFGFTGSLTEFFTFLRDTKDDERLYYPNTDEGRQGYLDDATAAINKIKAELPNYFGILPKADMVVKRVEAFREQDGAAQHYFASTPDGSRPGVYYAHLSDMTAMPKRELEVIAYHEGLPGHHMQIAIQQELTGIPTFRTQTGFTAYVEGWALYSEWLAKQMPGTYQDPLSEFGRLGSEIWRAIRLVVDTGLHAKGWTEEEAIDYFKANSAVTHEQAISEVRRYLVLPGQATSYKIGMLEIQKLRATAEKQLGDKFDIKQFHDTVLGGGALPLSILQRKVEQWIAKAKET